MYNVHAYIRSYAWYYVRTSLQAQHNHIMYQCLEVLAMVVTTGHIHFWWSWGCRKGRSPGSLNNISVIDGPLPFAAWCGVRNTHFLPFLHWIAHFRKTSEPSDRLKPWTLGRPGSAGAPEPQCWVVEGRWVLEVLHGRCNQALSVHLIKMLS